MERNFHQQHRDYQRHEYDNWYPVYAGEPLQKITINQREAGERIRFDLEDSKAFEGTRSERGQQIGLKDASSDRKTKTVSLTFDTPLPPGKTVTIGLKPRRNPSVAGVYLFGVTAFPPGENAHGQLILVAETSKFMQLV